MSDKPFFFLKGGLIGARGYSLGINPAAIAWFGRRNGQNYDDSTCHAAIAEVRQPHPLLVKFARHFGLPEPQAKTIYCENARQPTIMIYPIGAQRSRYDQAFIFPFDTTKKADQAFEELCRIMVDWSTRNAA